MGFRHAIAGLAATLALAAPHAAAQFVVTNTNDSGPGSLRQALLDSASCSATASVTFAIVSAAAGPYTIQPQSELPPLACIFGMSLDAYTQAGALPNGDFGGGNDASIQVILDGSACGACSGLVVTAGGDTISGFAIRSFSGHGIEVRGGSAQVFGNYIGTDPGGTPFGNGGYGVHVAGGFASVGSAFSAANRNLITANGGGGILVTSGGTQIHFNQIGGARDGGSAIGNAGAGIFYESSALSGFVSDNYIRYNAGAGVIVSSPEVEVIGGSIHSNGGIGIDLNNDGATANDTADADAGPNDLLNYPTILTVGGCALACDGIPVTAELQTPYASTPVRFDFYSNTGFSPDKREGETYQGSVSGTTDATGYVSLTKFVGSGANLSATAAIDTCFEGCWITSEFSPMFTPLAPPTVAVSFVPASIKLGFPATFRVVVSNPHPTLTLSNIDYATGSPAGMSVTGSNIGGDCFAADADFSAGPSGVSLLDLPPGASCTVDYTLNPTAEGTFTVRAGTFTVSSAVGTGSNAADATLGVVFVPPTFNIGVARTTTVGANTPISIGVSRAVDDPTYAGIGATLNFPGGATISPIPNAGTACGASINAVTGNSFMSASGGSIGGATLGCGLVGAQVIFPTAGTYTITLDAGAASITSPKAYAIPTPITVTIVVNPAPAPAVDLAPSSLTFAGQPVGTTSVSQSVTLKNVGTATLNMSAITVTGDFTRSGCAVASLAAGASCTMSVAFQPTALGARSGTLQVASNAAGSPHSVALTGTGTVTPAPQAQLSSTVVAFGSTAVGATSPPQVVTLSNVGSANLVVSAIAIAGDFAYSGCGFPLTLAPGASCDFSITFRPLTTGAHTGGIDVTSNAAGSPHHIGLSGNAVATASPAIVVLPPSVSFGTVGVGSSSSQGIRVQNAGNAPLAIFAIDAPAAPFSSATDCPTSLPPLATCSITAGFAPTAAGVFNGQVLIRTNADPPASVVTLQGEGAALPPPLLGVSRSSVDFGQVVIGLTGVLTVELRNGGGQPLQLGALSLPAPFSVAGDCATIAPGGSCVLTLFFDPAEIRLYHAFLQVNSTNGGGAAQVEIFGEGVRVPVPEIELSVAGLGFGNQGLGTPSSPQVFRVRSVGGVAVELRNFVAAPADFQVDATACPAVLARDASCEVRVTFRPRAAGGRSGRVTVVSSMEGQPPSVSLTGTGCRFFSLGAGRNPSRLCSP